MKIDEITQRLKIVAGLSVKILATVIVALLLLECGVRVILSFSLNNYLTKILPCPYGSIMRRAERFDCSARCRSLSVVKFDPVCYFIPRNGFFRGPQGRIDCPKEKEDHEIRVICIGDSTTYGFAVDYYDSWVYLLGKTLSEKYPEKNIRVLNAGLPGASPRQVKRFFQIYLAAYHPDILIWRSEHSLTDSYFVDEASDFIRFFTWRCLYESRIFRVLCVLWDRDIKNRRPYADIVHDFLTNRNPRKQKPSEKFDSDFSMVRKIAQGHGTRYTLQVERLYCDDRGVISSQLGVPGLRNRWPVVYTLDAFQEYKKNNPSGGLFVDNVHLTKAGEAITAGEISKFIIDSKWIESFN